MHKAHKVFKVQRVLMEQQVHKVLPAPRVIQGRKAYKVFRV